jgi:multiple sugar transport system ATP-binding protein
MSSVRFEQVTKRYGKVTAVKDLNLLIRDKEFLVLVGPSGCGKTTTLRCLAGLEQVDEGRIWIDDQIVNKVPAKDRDISMVFQDYALYPHMSVFRNMAFSLELSRTPKDEIFSRVQNAGQRLGIERLFKRNPQELSGGHQQAVAVGRTLVRVPKVFLYDDPLSNLDAKQRVQTRSNLVRLHQQLKTTFVYVTHDQSEAMSMATRIAVMNKGELQQVGRPQRIYNQPANLFVAGFIGSPAMNFFPAIIRQSANTLLLDVDSFKLEIPQHLYNVYLDQVGVPLVLGIRPEDIYNPQYVPQGIEFQLVDCQVGISEFMGHEIQLHLHAEKHTFVARVDPRTRVKSGESIQVAFNMDKMHLFDRYTEKAIR